MNKLSGVFPPWSPPRKYKQARREQLADQEQPPVLVPNRDERLNDSKNIVYAPIDDPRWREEDLQDTWAEEFSPSLMDEATPRSSPRRLKRHRSLSQDGDGLNPLLSTPVGCSSRP